MSSNFEQVSAEERGLFALEAIRNQTNNIVKETYHNATETLIPTEIKKDELVTTSKLILTTFLKAQSTEFLADAAIAINPDTVRRLLIQIIGNDQIGNIEKGIEKGMRLMSQPHSMQKITPVRPKAVLPAPTTILGAASSTVRVVEIPQQSDLRPRRILSRPVPKERAIVSQMAPRDTPLSQIPAAELIEVRPPAASVDSVASADFPPLTKMVPFNSPAPAPLGSPAARSLTGRPPSAKSWADEMDEEDAENAAAAAEAAGVIKTAISVEEIRSLCKDKVSTATYMQILDFNRKKHASREQVLAFIESQLTSTAIQNSVMDSPPKTEIMQIVEEPADSSEQETKESTESKASAEVTMTIHKIHGADAQPLPVIKPIVPLAQRTISKLTQRKAAEYLKTHSVPHPPAKQPMMSSTDAKPTDGFTPVKSVKPIGKVTPIGKCQNPALLKSKTSETFMFGNIPIPPGYKKPSEKEDLFLHNTAMDANGIIRPIGWKRVSIESAKYPWLNDPKVEVYQSKSGRPYHRLEADGTYTHWAPVYDAEGNEIDKLTQLDAEGLATAICIRERTH